MGNSLLCGRYDTFGNLHRYWVNGAIAERRCRANPSEGDAKAILTTGLRWSAKGQKRRFGDAPLTSFTPINRHLQSPLACLKGAKRRHSDRFHAPGENDVVSLQAASVTKVVRGHLLALELSVTWIFVFDSPLPVPRASDRRLGNNNKFRVQPEEI